MEKKVSLIDRVAEKKKKKKKKTGFSKRKTEIPLLSTKLFEDERSITKKTHTKKKHELNLIFFFENRDR